MFFIGKIKKAIMDDIKSLKSKVEDIFGRLEKISDDYVLRENFHALNINVATKLTELSDENKKLTVEVESLKKELKELSGKLNVVSKELERMEEIKKDIEVLAGDQEEINAEKVLEDIFEEKSTKTKRRGRPRKSK